MRLYARKKNSSAKIVPVHKADYVSIICLQEPISEGDTIRTIIKFLSNEYFQERALAVSLLYELSTLEPLCEKIGAVYGAILILVGMASSKAENIVAIEHAESTLKNLEKCEANIKPMAENGRLMPLLKKLIEGNLFQ